jgi:hypothetical protein
MPSELFGDFRLLYSESDISVLRTIGQDHAHLRFTFTTMDGDIGTFQYQFDANAADAIERGMFTIPDAVGRKLRLIVTKYLEDEDALFELDDGSAVQYGNMSIPMELADRLFVLGAAGPYQPPPNTGNNTNTGLANGANSIPMIGPHGGRRRKARKARKTQRRRRSH